jgi:hypothetical protein
MNTLSGPGSHEISETGLLEQREEEPRQKHILHPTSNNSLWSRRRKEGDSGLWHVNHDHYGMVTSREVGTLFMLSAEEDLRIKVLSWAPGSHGWQGVCMGFVSRKWEAALRETQRELAWHPWDHSMALLFLFPANILETRGGASPYSFQRHSFRAAWSASSPCCPLAALTPALGVWKRLSGRWFCGESEQHSSKGDNDVDPAMVQHADHPQLAGWK